MTFEEKLRLFHRQRISVLAGLTLLEIAKHEGVPYGPVARAVGVTAAGNVAGPCLQLSALGLIHKPAPTNKNALGKGANLRLTQKGRDFVEKLGE